MRCRAVFVALLVLGACGRKRADDPPCGVVGARLFTLASEDLAKATVDPSTRRAVDDQLPAMRDALVTACTDGAWSAASRACMANATDHTAFQTCQQQLSDAQRQALDRASRGETLPH